MKILITGGGGFIGSSLALALGSTHDIIALDHGRWYSLLERRMPPCVSLVRGDVSDAALLDTLLPGVNIIVHLAGVVGESRCKNDPVKAVMSNVLGTHILLERARRHGIKLFLFGSSYWVYSFYDDRPMPLTESDELRTDSFYGALKASSEREIQDSALPYIIVRLANVYGYGTGVGSLWRALVGKFIRSAFEGKPLTLYGEGSQGLELVHIEDVVNALRALIESKTVRNEIVNIGSGGVHSIRDIAHTVQRLAVTHLGSAAIVLPVPAPPGKIWPDRWLSIEKIKQIVPSFPRVPFEDGVLEVLKKYQEFRPDSWNQLDRSEAGEFTAPKLSVKD